MTMRVISRVVPDLAAFVVLVVVALVLPAHRGARAVPATGAEPAQETVRFESGANTLAGTLFRPAAKADCPAVVLLGGSDRSERGALRVALARNFASHGTASLIYDSPGTGGSTGNALVQTPGDRVAEARAAVAFLRGLEGIRSGAVGIFGGSEGANIALLACAGDPSVAFVIPVSSSLGIPTADILQYSTEYRGRRLGLTDDEISRAVTFKEIAFAVLGGGGNGEDPSLESRVVQWNDPAWNTFLDLSRMRAGALTAEERTAFLDSMKRVVGQFAGERWFGAVDVGGAVQRLLRMDTATFFALVQSGRYAGNRTLDFGPGAIRCPVLAIWGEEDSFLPPRESAARLKQHLVDSAHSDHEIIVFENAGHFLTTSDSGADFVPGYLDTMTRWLDRHVGSGAGSGR